jgi:hypothetical protein
VFGAGAEEMYAATVRYYKQLLFLCDQEAPHSSTSSMQEEGNYCDSCTAQQFTDSWHRGDDLHPSKLHTELIYILQV